MTDIGEKSPIQPQDALTFKVIQSLYWSSFAFYYVYFVYYLHMVRGYSNSSIGMISALAALVTLVSHNFWGYISDKFENIKAVVITLLAVSAILVSTFPLYPNIVAIGLVACLIAFFEPPTSIILDSWIAQYLLYNRKSHYGGIRAWGSISATLAFVLLGRLVMLVSINWVFHMYAIFPLLAIFFCSRIRFTIKSIEKPKILKNIPKLLKNMDYMIFVTCAALIMTSFRAASLFIPNKVIAVGGSQADISIVWVITTLSEVPVLFLGQYLFRKYKVVHLCLFAFCMFFVRILLYFLADNIYMVYASHALNGFTFGIFLPIAVLYITEIAPKEIKTSALTLATACYSGIGTMLGSFIGGLLLDQWGLRWVYGFGMMLSLVGILVFALYHMMNKKILKGVW